MDTLTEERVKINWREAKVQTYLCDTEDTIKDFNSQDGD